jgi:transcriptional regulator with XRE-family HTH domain
MWLRGEREARGITMAALAHKVGITYTHISKIEVGRAKPSREIVRNLTKALDSDLRTGLIVARMLPPEFHTLTDKRLQQIVVTFPKLSAEAQEEILRIAASASATSQTPDDRDSAVDSPQEGAETSPSSSPANTLEQANRLFDELPPDILELSVRIAEKMVELSKQGRKT